MKHRIALLLAVTAFAAACASGGAPRGTNMDRSRWAGDPELYEILLQYPMSAAQQDSMAAFAARNLNATYNLLADAAEDVNAPASVRVNAMMVLAQRRDPVHLPVFRELLDDDDVRIRASAVAALREFTDTHPYETVRIARVALLDSEPDVQAQALQILGDNDLDALRAYLPRAANDDLRAVARDLVRVAEERGAPVARDSATGVLRRESSAGYTVTFTPRREWPQWDAAYGVVTIARGTAELARLEGVEAVAGVVPVFFSPDGRHVVYERDRTIVVRTIEGGSERVLGSGIAPRALPFTESFAYLRQVGEPQDQRAEHRVRYDVIIAPFDEVSGRATTHASTTANISFGRRGAFSPVRWMRVEERVGHFYLTAEHMDMVSLPDPFAHTGG